MACLDLSPLFRPLRLGPVTLRNRFVLPAMQIGFTEHCGPSARMIAYLKARAEGGAGLVFSESCAPDHPSSYWQPVFCVLNRETEPGWARVIDGVKSAGAAFILQLWHPGGQRVPRAGFVHAEAASLSPSGLIQAGRTNGRAMTAGELDDLKAAYIHAAEAAKRLGADGIELHAAHGYLLDQFLWAETNRRDDGYGGPLLADRARFPLELAEAIRAAAGPDFLVSLRFSQFKEVDYGARVFPTPEELAEFGLRARLAGLDLLNVSSRRFTKPEWPERDLTLGIAGWTKKLSGLPVITTGSVGLDTDMFADLFDGQDPALRLAADLEELVRRFAAGEFDLVGIGRMQIANPDFVNKLADRRLDGLRLYNKQVDLGQLFAQIEPGMMEESRTIADV
ncbi:MAG TPA: 12-oxophytodienoate reductase [Allosphingosinicella sp.]|nr:12-oxophytodienoate reductase [Allosphingosinicella sp.]